MGVSSDGGRSQSDIVKPEMTQEEGWIGAKRDCRNPFYLSGFRGWDWWITGWPWNPSTSVGTFGLCRLTFRDWQRTWKWGSTHFVFCVGILWSIGLNQSIWKESSKGRIWANSKSFYSKKLSTTLVIRYEGTLASLRLLKPYGSCVNVY